MSHVPYPSAAVELHEDALAAQREERWDAAEVLFRQAFEAGHPVAAYDLGTALLDRGDRNGAKTWYRRAAEQGVPAAAFEVGYLEERGGDLDEAERWYRRAAEGGHRSGTLNLGVLVEDRGDVPAALELYQRAWELGDSMAAFNIGKIHDDDGRGDLAKAAEWYGRAAERGNGGAAYNLGHVRQDQGDTAAQAAAWRRAADLGHPKAACSLGIMFQRQGDQDEAAAWLRRSVEEFGNQRAAGLLADICERRGDRGEARFWRDLPYGLGAYSPRFEAFASEGAAAAIHRQDVLNKALGDGHVRFDIGERTMTVDGETYGGVTLLGSFAHESRSWLWAWANEHYRDDDPAVAPLRAIRAYGREHDIPELTVGYLDLSGFPNPHQAATTMAIAAAALLGGNGVHSCRINDGRGSAYLHLDDPRLPTDAYDPISAPRLVMTAVEVFPADHRRVVRGLIAHYGTGLAESPDVIQGRFPDGRSLTVGFTEQGLVKAITSENVHSTAQGS
ncbi:tetratricopeptide repeat protein [Actinomadura sp. DC4]|uniref:SEL1-like repeat protein n=1 Tax=Actinomadura sp. DC4 TaxID=3055069 RepID=UPI0025AF5352|nr:tetratricopeptide repeat protein [Actinomadura sp. DC4]MDN3357733.1 tetratricopeptide repeat protein [Actinomadura sp. DC4]